MIERRGELAAAFLERHGWGEAQRRPLAGDASFRRYERLFRREANAVLMDAPPEAGEDCRPFVAIGNYLRSIGLSAPEVIAADLEQGLLLLEDLGDDLYVRALLGGADEVALYEQAVDLLLSLHERDQPTRLPVPAADWFEIPLYSAERLRAEADLLPDWYLPELTGRQTPADLRAEYAALWDPLMPSMLGRSGVLVVRDYHAENLLWLPERAGLARVGLLDYQDGVLGHAAYDLVSLLSDARRDVDPALADAMLARYIGGARARNPAFDGDEFRTAFAVLGAQRNCKIIGIFARLWRRDGKPAYLSLLPRVWRNLERDLRDPVLSPLKLWLDRVVPPEYRAAPLAPDARIPLSN